MFIGRRDWLSARSRAGNPRPCCVVRLQFRLQTKSAMRHPLTGLGAVFGDGGKP